MTVIVIDPGHGGEKKVEGSSPNNATGPNGLLEKDIVLDIALRLRQRHGHRHIIVLTRDRDINVGLRQRAEMAKARAAQVFVSLHMNANGGKAQGTEVWVHSDRKGPASERLASCLQNSILAATGFTGRGDRGVRIKNLGVLRPKYHAPGTVAGLAELSFLDEIGEAKRLESAEYRDRLADAVMAGIKLYLSDEQEWGRKRYAPIKPTLWEVLRGLFAPADLDG